MSLKSIARMGVGVALMLLPSTASATINFTVQFTAGSNNFVVMGADSVLSFRVTNTSTAGESLNNIKLGFPSTYTITSGASDSWTVNQIVNTGNPHTIQFFASACTYAVAAGASRDFSVHVTPAASTQDQTDTMPSVVYTKSVGPNGCRQTTTKTVTTGLPSWTRKSLDASLSASPIAVTVGAGIAVTMDVTNRTTALQNPITPSVSAYTGDTGACTLSSASPASLSLAAGASGQFTWTCTATAVGTVYVQGNASRGATVTSAVVSSNTVSIGNFTAVLSMNPDSVLSGSAVTITMQVTNQGTTALTNVAGTSPCGSQLCKFGTATSAYVSGPTPSSVSQLKAGDTTSFTWVYTVSGAVNQTYYFTGYATADGPQQTSVATSETGQVAAYTVTSAPASVLRNTANKTVTWTVANSGSTGVKTVTINNPDTTNWKNPSSNWTATCNGCSWSCSKNAPYACTSPNNATCYIKQGQSPCDFPVTFSQVGTATTPASNTDYTFRVDLKDTNNVTTSVNTVESIVLANPPADVDDLTVASANGTATLHWTNPAVHDGVVILRVTGTSTSCSPPNTAPTQGQEYTVGNVIGNATVAYADKNGSLVNSSQNTGLTNGTYYCYMVFNHDSMFQYATGNVPSANGISALPTSGVEPYPIWTFSVGVATMLTPTVNPGVGVYTASNLGLVNGINTLNADEIWRPVDVGGAIQNRMTVVPLSTGQGTWIYTGAQNGVAYAIDSATGVVKWSRDLRTNPNDIIMAAPIMHSRTVATAAFNAKYADDLVYFVTRNDTSLSRTNNKVYALDAVDGSVAWTFAPGNLDMMVASPALDFYHDKIFVFSYAGAASNQPSLWVLDALNNGAILGSQNLGDLDATGVFSGSSRAYVSFPARSGIVYSLNTGDYSQRWTFDTGAGAGSSFSQLQRATGGFAFSGAGKVYRIVDNGTSATQSWAVPVAGPSSVIVFNNQNVLYVGSSDGKLYELDLGTGAVRYSKTLGSAVGSPGGDTSPGADGIIAGTLGGMVFKFHTPFTASF